MANLSGGCCCTCCSNDENDGFTIRRANNCWKFRRILTYFSLIFMIGFIVWYVSQYWSKSILEKIAETIIAAGFILGGISVVFRVKYFLRRLLHRKRIFHKKAKSDLKKILTIIGNCIPDNNQLRIITEQAYANMDEVVKLLRKTFSGKRIELSLNGSAAERFGAPLSSEWILIKEDINDSHALITDFDFIINIEGISASHHRFNGDFEIKTNEDGIDIGFAKIYCQNSQINETFKMENGLLTATSVKKQILKSINETTMSLFPGFKKYVKCCCYIIGSKDHVVKVEEAGPAIKLKFSNNKAQAGPMIIGNVNFSFTEPFYVNQFLADITFSIPCKEWPHLSDWPRWEIKWLESDQVQRIANLGCDLVPKSQPKDRRGTTWRYSFSRAEVELSKLIMENARNCFLVLKIIGKDYLFFCCPQLNSYHLKTVFLYKLERTPQSYWVEENIEEALVSLLLELKTAADTKNCPHYWIPTINLFKCFSNRSLKTLSKLLSKITVDAAEYIEDPSPFFQARDNVNGEIWRNDETPALVHDNQSDQDMLSSTMISVMEDTELQKESFQGYFDVPNYGAINDASKAD